MSLPIEETIAELGNSANLLLSSRLIELSNLDSTELEFLEQVLSSRNSNPVSEMCNLMMRLPFIWKSRIWAAP